LSNEGKLAKIFISLNRQTTAQQHASLYGRNFGPAPSSAMTFSVNREGGDSDMTSNKTKHPLPHPSRRARKRGSKPDKQNFFKNNYSLKKHKYALHGHKKIKK
jgi:hypothetical protein